MMQENSMRDLRARWTRAITGVEARERVPTWITTRRVGAPNLKVG